jgi:hypothetical protein
VRPFVALLERDWRTHRVTFALIAAAILGLSLLFRALSTDARHWTFIAGSAVPAMWVLFVGGLAADLIACEFTARRIEAVALLPVGLLRVWLSKMTFLAAALAVFLAWTLGCQIATFALFDGSDPAADPYRVISIALELAVFVLPLAAATAFVALLVERTLPALFLGFLVAGGFFAGLRFVLEVFEPALAKHTGAMVALWQALAVAFAAAGAITFVSGAVHTQGVVRRWVVAGILMLHLVLVVALFVGWRYWTWKQLDPGDPIATIASIAASPSGDRVVVLAAKSAGGETAFGTCRVWSVAVDGDAPVVELARDRAFDQFAPWNADGSLRIYRREGSLCTRDDVDPATGVVRATKSYDVSDGDPDLRGQSYPWWAKFDTVAGWTRGAKFTTGVHWKDRNVTRRYSGVYGLAVSRVPGVVWYLKDDRTVVRGVLDANAESVVLTSPAPLDGLAVSPDGKRLLIMSQRETRAVDAATGQACGGPWTSPWVTWPFGADDGRLVLLFGDGPHTLVDVSSGRSVGLGNSNAERSCGSVEVRELADGRVVVLSLDGRVDLLSSDLRLVRHLYPLQED